MRSMPYNISQSFYTNETLCTNKISSVLSPGFLHRQYYLFLLSPKLLEETVLSLRLFFPHGAVFAYIMFFFQSSTLLMYLCTMLHSLLDILVLRYCPQLLLGSLHRTAETGHQRNRFFCYNVWP